MWGLNRTLCDTLNEMRECDKTKNYSYLLGLIEEAQSMGNRMESALSDQKDLEYNRRKIKESIVEINELEKKIKKLKD